MNSDEALKKLYEDEDILIAKENAIEAEREQWIKRYRKLYVERLSDEVPGKKRRIWKRGIPR